MTNGRPLDEQSEARRADQIAALTEAVTKMGLTVGDHETRSAYRLFEQPDGRVVKATLTVEDVDLSDYTIATEPSDDDDEDDDYAD